MTLDLHATAASRLRDDGQRYTTQRRALVDLLESVDQPLTIPQLLEHHPGLAQSSAYRNLAVLERAGVVHRIVTSDEFARYELAEDLTHHHHHLICSSCGDVDGLRGVRGRGAGAGDGAHPRRPPHGVPASAPIASTSSAPAPAARERPAPGRPRRDAPARLGLRQRGVVSGPPSDTGAGTWWAVGVAIAAAVLVLAALIVLPAWREGGSVLAAGVLGLQAAAAAVGAAILLGAAYQGAHVLTRPPDSEPP